MFASDLLFFSISFLCFVAQREFGKFQPKTKKKKQSGLSQPPVTSCGLLPVSKNSTTLSTPSLVLDETSSRNNELKAQPEKPQKEVNYYTSYGSFELNVDCR